MLLDDRMQVLPLRVDRVAFSDDRVARLVAEVQAHYAEIYGSPDESPVDPSEFDSPHGGFYLGLVADEPVAMGGWRRRADLDELLGAPTAEIKRMYVARAARRRGYARTILDCLEDGARAAGASLLALETGLMQPEAIALYEAAGYLPTVAFGHYARSPLARYYAKTL